MRKLLSALTAVLMIVAGCTPAAPPATAVPATTSPSPAPKSTATDPGRDLTCPEVSQLPAANISGRLVLEDSSRDNELSFLDLADGERTAIPLSGAFWTNGAVSPSGSLLAYHKDGPEEYTAVLTIVDAQGTEMVLMPWQDDWYDIGGWLNEEQLVLLRYDEDYENQIMAIISPFEGRQEIVDLDQFPDANEIDGWAIYDPTLTRVIYAGYGSKYLFDLESRQVLADISTSIDQERTETAWSADGRHAVVVASDPDKSSNRLELFLISRDGDITQLTDFKDHFGSSIGAVIAPSWSSDGRSIAFWASGTAPEDHDLRPVIIRLDMHEPNIYCFAAPRSSSGMHREPVPPPVWSPDGRLIVIMSEASRGERKSDVLLIDVERNLAFRIAEDAWPVGWMTGLP